MRCSRPSGELSGQPSRSEALSETSSANGGPQSDGSAIVTIPVWDDSLFGAALLVGSAGLALLFAVMPASAQHAFATEFDAKKAIKISGTITKREWTNPHAWLYVDVKDENGKLTSWLFANW